MVVGWLRLVVVFRLAVWLVVGGTAVVRAAVDREVVGQAVVGLNVVGLGVGLVVFEPAQ